MFSPFQVNFLRFEFRSKIFRDFSSRFFLLFFETSVIICGKYKNFVKKMQKIKISFLFYFIFFEKCCIIYCSETSEENLTFFVAIRSLFETWLRNVKTARR